MVDTHELDKQKDPLARVIELVTREPGTVRQLQDLKRTTAERWREEEEGYGKEVRLFVDGNGQPILVSRRNATLEFEDIPEAHDYRFAFDGKTVDVAVPSPLAGEYETARGSGGAIGIYDLYGASVPPSEELEKLAKKFGTYLYIDVPPPSVLTGEVIPLSLLGDGGDMLRAYDIDGIQEKAIREGLLDANVEAETTPAALGRHAVGRDDHF